MRVEVEGIVVTVFITEEEYARAGYPVMRVEFERVETAEEVEEEVEEEEDQGLVSERQAWDIEFLRLMAEEREYIKALQAA